MSIYVIEGNVNYIKIGWPFRGKTEQKFTISYLISACIDMFFFNKECVL